MKRVLGILAPTALGLLFLASPALAKTEPSASASASASPSTQSAPKSFSMKSRCHSDWYVNGDEEKLLPTQLPGGFLFNGPSLIHHAVEPVVLKDVPTDGSFTTFGPITGNKPLFKMETTAPYSTINKTGAGKYWSSKLSSGPGSQGSPVDSPADLVGKGPYTADTKVFSFGVGYANDPGNKALVTSVSFGGKKYGFACTSSPSPSASTSSSHSASPSPSVASLPVTGSKFNTPVAVGVGSALLVGGGTLFFLARRRRTEFRSE